jgi:anti-anti-sigma regulatory factor
VIVPARVGEFGTPEPLALSGRRVGRSAVLSVSGEIDLATAPELQREASRTLHDAPGRLILDLSARRSRI